MEPKDDGSVMWKQWSDLLKFAEDTFPTYAQYPVTYGKGGSQEVRDAVVAAWKDAYTSRMPANDGSEIYAKWKSWFEWCVWTIENTTELSYMLPQLLNDEDDLE